jgi:hypothetical protein
LVTIVLTQFSPVTQWDFGVRRNERVHERGN